MVSKLARRVALGVSAMSLMLAAAHPGAAQEAAQPAPGQAAPSQDPQATTAPGAPAPGLPPAPGALHDPSALALPDVIVVARKRAELMQDVPLSISAFHGEQLEARGIDQLSELALQVPNFRVDEGLTNAEVGITLRGFRAGAFSPGQESSVGIFVDGVYVNTLDAALFDFFDIEHVEILRGPQGTLFGKNTIAGAMNVITRIPTDEFQAKAQIEVANRERYKLGVGVSGGLAPGIAANFAAVYNEEQGYIENIGIGDDLIGTEYALSLRSAVRFQPNSNWVNDLTVDYSTQKTTSGVLLPLESLETATADLDTESSETRDNYGVSYRSSYDFKAIMFDAVLGYRGVEDERLADRDGTSTPQAQLIATTYTESDAYSADLRLSDGGDGWSWQVGLYLSDEETQNGEILAAAGTFSQPGSPFTGGDSGEQVSVNDRLSAAVYGQTTINLTEKLGGTFGLRYTREEHELSIATNGNFPPVIVAGPERFYSTSFENLSGKVSFDYRFSPQLLSYVSVAQGFKAGGINASSGIPASLENLREYDPETSISYEVGLKSDWFNRRLRLNGAAFFIEASDVQVRQSDAISTEQIVVNAASAQSYGLELEASAIISPQFNMSLAYGWNPTEIKEYAACGSETINNPPPNPPTVTLIDCSGNALPNAPEHTASLSLEFRQPVTDDMDLFLSTSASYTGDTQLSVQDKPAGFREAYTLFNLEIGARKPPPEMGWSLSLWGENLSDEVYFTAYADAVNQPGFMLPDRYLPAPPRSFGVRLRLR